MADFEQTCEAIQRWLDRGQTVIVTNCRLGYPDPESPYTLKIEPAASPRKGE